MGMRNGTHMNFLSFCPARWMEECVQLSFADTLFSGSGNRVFGWVWRVGGRKVDECYMHFPSLPSWHFSAALSNLLRKEAKTTPLDRWQYWRKRWDEEVSNICTLHKPNQGPLSQVHSQIGLYFNWTFSIWQNPSLQHNIYEFLAYEQETLCSRQNFTLHISVFAAQSTSFSF